MKAIICPSCSQPLTPTPSPQPARPPWNSHPPDTQPCSRYWLILPQPRGPVIAHTAEHTHRRPPIQLQPCCSSIPAQSHRNTYTTPHTHSFTPYTATHRQHAVTDYYTITQDRLCTYVICVEECVSLKLSTLKTFSIRVQSIGTRFSMFSTDVVQGLTVSWWTPLYIPNTTYTHVCAWLYNLLHTYTCSGWIHI